MNKVYVGNYTGVATTGTYVCIGFEPDIIIGFNSTDATLIMYSKQFTSGTTLTVDTEAALVTSGITTYNGGDVITTASTLYQNGQSGNVPAGRAPAGFYTGTESDINTASEVVYFIAFAVNEEARTLTAYESAYGADEGTD